MPSKVNSLRDTDQIARLIGKRTKKRKPMSQGVSKMFPAVSSYRSIEPGMIRVNRTYPVNARSPHMSYDRHAVPDREELSAMVNRGRLTGEWRTHNRSGCVLDKDKHRKALARIAQKANAIAKVRDKF